MSHDTPSLTRVSLFPIFLCFRVITYQKYTLFVFQLSLTPFPLICFSNWPYFYLHRFSYLLCLLLPLSTKTSLEPSSPKRTQLLSLDQKIIPSTSSLTEPFQFANIFFSNPRKLKRSFSFRIEKFSLFTSLNSPLTQFAIHRRLPLSSPGLLAPCARRQSLSLLTQKKPSQTLLFLCHSHPNSSFTSSSAVPSRTNSFFK